VPIQEQHDSERGYGGWGWSVGAYGVNIQVNNNGVSGISIVGGSVFVGDLASTQNNGTVGVRVVTHSTFTLFAGAITGNAESGVTVRGGSEANIQSVDGPINISSNGGNGVQIHDLSFAVLLSGAPPPIASSCHIRRRVPQRISVAGQRTAQSRGRVSAGSLHFWYRRPPSDDAEKPRR
jgi:hypothetical protein